MKVWTASVSLMSTPSRRISTAITLAGCHNARSWARFANSGVARFKAAAEVRPSDGPCRVLIARCTQFLRDGVPTGWDGTWRFDFK